MRKFTALLLIVLCCCGMRQRAFCAGNNKQRVRSFEWEITSTENFDVFYYKESAPILADAIIYIEESYQKLMSFYRIPPQKEKVPFFLFAEHNQFEQTNIVNIGEGTGGVTEAFKNRLLVFNNGSQLWLKNVIIHEMTHIMEFYILYGGFWKSVRLLKSFFYPLWVMEGLAEYGTGEIDRTTREMYVRDAATSGGLISLVHLHNFNHLKPHQITLAYKESEMAIRFLADEYGIEKVIRLLPTFKSRFDAHAVLTSLIGIDLFRFSRKFIERLEEEYGYLSEGMKEPDAYGLPVTTGDDIPRFNTNPVFGPDGDEIIYMSDWKGYPELYAYSISDKKHTLVLGGKPRHIENISSAGHALSVSPDGRYIAFSAEQKQKNYIYVFDRKRKKLKRFNNFFDRVTSPCFSPDGNSIAFVGMKESISDIYIMDLRNNKIKRITDDRRDDNYPIFTPDGKHLVYSTEVYLPDADITYQRDIYQVEIETSITEPLVSLPDNETGAAFSPDGAIMYFTNDQGDAWNIYQYHRETGIVKKLTNVIGSNFTPSVSPDGSLMVFSSFRKGNIHVYLADTDYIPELTLSAVKADTIFTADLDSGVTEQYRVDMSSGTASEPYRFSASTDLFFPILFYSSLDGLFAQVYWQGSEMLGNHQSLSSIGYASGDELLNYNFTYAYLKWKPRIILRTAGENFYEDFNKTERRTEHLQFVGLSYPFTRFARLDLGGATLGRTFRFRELDNRTLRTRENIAVTSFLYDVTSGRYLEVRRGYRLRLTYEQSDKDIFNSDFDYRTHIFEGSHFTPIGPTTFIMRMLGGVSFGATPGLFRLGGVDRLRGYPRRSDAFKAPRAAMLNAEWRIPLAKLNYYVWYLFPDFFFKRLTGVVFTDTGFLWESGDELRSASHKDILNSVGVGLRFYSFVMQTFRLDLNFDWAHRTTDGTNIFYFTIGPVFDLSFALGDLSKSGTRSEH